MSSSNEIADRTRSHIFYLIQLLISFSPVRLVPSSDQPVSAFHAIFQHLCKLKKQTITNRL